MIDLNKKVKLVGEFIRKRREILKLSQRSLGLLFDPPVTTQFISNVERGVTPLPPMHIPVLAKALAVSSSELTMLLEKEYALKLNGRLGNHQHMMTDENMEISPSLTISKRDYDFIRGIYDAYRMADIKTKQAFVTVCESILMVPKPTIHE
jgi:hypothetical protein